MIFFFFSLLLHATICSDTLQSWNVHCFVISDHKVPQYRVIIIEIPIATSMGLLQNCCKFCWNENTTKCYFYWKTLRSSLSWHQQCSAVATMTDCCTCICFNLPIECFMVTGYFASMPMVVANGNACCSWLICWLIIGLLTVL